MNCYQCLYPRPHDGRQLWIKYAYKTTTVLCLTKFNGRSATTSIDPGQFTDRELRRVQSLAEIYTTKSYHLLLCENVLVIIHAADASLASSESSSSLRSDTVSSSPRMSWRLRRRPRPPLLSLEAAKEDTSSLSWANFLANSSILLARLSALDSTSSSSSAEKVPWSLTQFNSPHLITHFG